METVNIFSKYIPNFIMILLRAGIMFSFIPFFSSTNLPAQFRIGLIVAVALVLTPVIEFKVSLESVPYLVMREVIFGIALGFASRLVFFAVDMAGQLMSNAMGLSIATVFNPEIGQSTEIAQMYGIAASLVFLAMDVHHDLIYIFARSYELLPAGSVEMKNLISEAVTMGSKLFILALKISAPVVIVMLISNLLLGFMYKAAPQINVFFIGFPIYMFVGFIMMIIGIPVFVFVSGNYFNAIKDDMLRVISMAKG